MAATAPKQHQENPKKEPQKKEEGSGLVKSVPSGDTLVLLLLDKAQGGPPPEKEITFSSLVAPRPARFRGSKDDEHFAWQSREFLRKKVIGKVVHYSIEYTVEGEKKNHHYGVIKLGEENVNESVLLEGWCRVKPLGGKAIRPEQQHWLDLSAQAEAEHKGVFNKAEAEHSVRKFSSVGNAALAQKVQGTTVQGVVESVRDGTSVRVVFKVKDQWFEPLLSLAGAQSPMFKFDQASQEAKPEPFAREAKFFVERLLLHREVQITVQGVDKQENPYGTVLFNGRNICEELIKSGLARFVQWNAPAGSTEAWRELESVAKAQHLRIWKDAVAPKAPTSTSAGNVVGAQFSGKVREVLSAGVIVVQIGNEKRPLPLSSITVPRMITVKEREAGKDDEAYAFEAKEFLRTKLIGKKVNCTLDYVRPRIEKKADKPELPEKAMYSVLLDKGNVAVQLVEEGLATVITHRKEDPCSPHYDLLLQAETKAKQKNRGVHNKEPPSKVLDISKDVKGAKQRFPFFQRAGRQNAVIEYVFNPTRFRLYIPKERVFVNFALSALRSTDDANLLSAATEWTREKLHQRDVEIEIENQDRGGTFLGSLYLKKKFFALTLVELGYAKVYEGGSGRIPHGGELQNAQDQAKKEKRGLWANYDPEAEKKKLQEEEEARQQQTKKEIVNLSVTEVVDGSWFFANIIGEEHSKLQELNQEIASASHSLIDPAALKKGTLVLSQFSGDDTWYRARIEGRSGESEWKVSYIDFGNVETVGLTRLRKLDPKFTTLPPQAKECFLAYITTPQLSDDYGKEAAVFFREMVWGKTVVGNIEYREGHSLHLIVGDPDSQVHVNAALVHQGLARVNKKFQNTLVAKLREEEDKAKKSHLGIWRYGDDEDDDY